MAPTALNIRKCSANVILGHSVPFVVVGTFILFFGWFGFNINTYDSMGLNAINTLLAGATGAGLALYIVLMRKGTTDILMACNGALAGLVGITAGAAFVEPWSAVVIGAIAAPIMMGSVTMIEKMFKIDDPVSAISVHGVTGLWGLLAVGIFANGNNGVSGLVVGNTLQIVSQLISMGVVLAWGLATGFALFLLLKTTMGIRVTPEEEMADRRGLRFDRAQGALHGTRRGSRRSVDALPGRRRAQVRNGSIHSCARLMRGSQRPPPLR